MSLEESNFHLKQANPWLEPTAPIGARKQRRFCICGRSCGEAGFAWPGAAAQLESLAGLLIHDRCHL